MRVFYSSKSKGYTLIEMVVVIAILAVVVPTIFSIIYVLIQQQLRIYRVSETKRQGDRMTQQIKERILREAGGIYKKNGTERCASPAGTPETTVDGTDFIFAKTKNGPVPGFFFSLSSNELLLTESSPSVVSTLHSPTVSISNVRFECIRKNTISNPIVGISYDVTFVDQSPTAQEGAVNFPYLLKLKMRR